MQLHLNELAEHLLNFVGACSPMDASMDERAKPIYYSEFTF